MKIEKPTKVSLSKQVLNQMEKCIINEVWKVGEKIPAEPELVKSFGVSRNTIREAVQSLIHSGILDARQGDGTYILASNRFEATINQRLMLCDINEILEARSSIEKEIVCLASIKRNEDDLENIKSCLEKRNSQGIDLNTSIQYDIDFHTAIAKACHNSILFDYFKYMTSYIYTIIDILSREPNFNWNLNLLHSDLYISIKEKNPSKAEEILLKILELDKEFLSKTLEE